MADVKNSSQGPNEMERMNESSFATVEAKVYRFSWLWRLYHFAFGAVGLVGAVTVYDVSDELPIVSVVLALVSLFMISRPLILAVTVDQFSVTFRGVFRAKSLQRSSITAVETKSDGKFNYLILWGNTIDGNERLAIPLLFAFDEAWYGWLRTYRDLNKPLSLF